VLCLRLFVRDDIVRGDCRGYASESGKSPETIQMFQKGDESAWSAESRRAAYRGKFILSFLSPNLGVNCEAVLQPLIRFNTIFSDRRLNYRIAARES
jgi:hypothetical protein